MNVLDAFHDVYLSAARPELVAGRRSATRALRWVHASEQLDIAPLLRGGELILMEGANFGRCSDADLVTYVDSLNAAGVVGIAVETGAHLEAIPPSLIEHAEQIGFPVVQLRRRVPFVQVCESINSQLADSALRRLQMADRMSRLLSASIETDGAVNAVLDVLGVETRSSVTLHSMSGELIGQSGLATAPSDFTAFDVPVTSGGRDVAVLTVVPGPDADIYLINAGLERAPEILSIALLSAHPATEGDRLRTRFFSLLSAINYPASDVTDHLDGVAERMGIPESDAYLTLSVEFDDDSHAGTLQRCADSATPRNWCQRIGDRHVAVLGFESWAVLDAQRPVVLSMLQSTELRVRRAVVGPGASDRHGLRRCFSTATAVLALDLAPDARIRDARDFTVALLVEAMSGESTIERFVHDQIGTLLAHDRERHSELFATLLAYVTHWGSKTETAKSLRIQRQTLYKRLDTVFDVLGPLPAGSPRFPGIATALFLEQARRQGRVGLGS
ncbi:MAG: PucR family transcriptional regulator [Rhodococcus sp. (in: high G+C Gram-positive bacteria)]